MKIALFFFCVLLAVNPAHAQNNAPIDETVTRLIDAANVTGVCVGIIKNNQVVYIKAYGYKNKPRQLLNDTSTCFYAASLAKSVFAYLVMQLVDEDKLNLDTPLYRYLAKPLPEYDSYKDLAGDDRWKLLTARMCLDHSTGFPNWRFLNPHHNNKLAIFFTPGSRYAYSGEGICLLQFVVEQITGEKLDVLARQRIFGPFGMNRTDYVWQTRFESDYAIGYDTKGDSLIKRRRAMPNAAGSMETTIADYTRFMVAVMQHKHLSEKAWDEMLKPQISIHSKQQFPSLNTKTTKANDRVQLAYGLGWGLFQTPKGKAFFKEGHDDGWVHYVIGFPGTKEAYVVMCNSSNGESIFKELFENLAGVTIPWYWENYIPYK